MRKILLIAALLLVTAILTTFQARAQMGILSTCERSPAVAKAISEALMNKPCAEITSDDLAQITFLAVVGPLDNVQANDFQGLTGLLTLRMIDAKVKTIASGAFRDLMVLNSLDLSRNEIKELPDGAFDGLTQLTTLTLNANKIERISSSAFRHLSSIEVLTMSDNNIKELPESAFVGLFPLRRLQLNGNRELKTLAPMTFGGLTQLAELNISDCGLESLPSGLLRDQLSLTELRLTKNKLTSLPGDLLATAFDLKWLNLAHNKITSIPDNFLLSPTKLEEINLDANQITELKAETMQWGSNFRVLVKLAGNPLTQTTIDDLKLKIGNRFYF